MKPEIEVKFLNIDLEEIRKQLSDAGAHLEQPMRLMRRVNIEQPEHKAIGAWIRVRDEGDKVTLTWKQGMNKDVAILGRLDELEVIVSNFDDTVDIFRHAGWPAKTYQESKRETWKLGEAEVVIDEWPWLPHMIEIEGEDEQTVRKAAEQLGLSWDDAHYGNIDDVYQLHYDFKDEIRGVIDLAEVKFGTPVPVQFKERNGS